MRQGSRTGTVYDFGLLAATYDRWYDSEMGRAHDRVQQADVKVLLPPARVGGRLLEVGCGTGHWSRFFASLGYRVEGIDVSAEMIAVARASVPEARFMVADACDLPFEGGAFEVVAAMATLEFIGDVDAAVSEMARCTTLGGCLVIGTLNRLAPLNRHRIAKGEQPYVSGRLFSPRELRSLVSPWGRVRMVASPVGMAAARDISPVQTQLSGPFIVAVVER